MEKGLAHLSEVFDLPDQDLRTFSPLTLAYIGDGAYEIVIRTVLVKQGNCPVNQLHKKASQLVKAQTQSAMMDILDLQKGKECTFPHNGKACVHGRLSSRDGV